MLNIIYCFLFLLNHIVPLFKNFKANAVVLSLVLVLPEHDVIDKQTFVRCF
jgi:hypothetical protein